MSMIAFEENEFFHNIFPLLLIVVWKSYRISDVQFIQTLVYIIHCDGGFDKLAINFHVT